MYNYNSFILINNIKLPFDASVKEAFSVAIKKLNKNNIRGDISECFVYKKSIDARKRDEIFFVWSIGVKFDAKDTHKISLNDKDISYCEDKFPEFNIGKEKLSAPPVIIGAGPCGLFAALILAENGYNPIVIERGGSVSERKKAIERMNALHTLDTDTNIQFGAGGAGTFSDGKLITRINDPLCNYVHLLSFLVSVPERTDR